MVGLAAVVVMGVLAVAWATELMRDLNARVEAITEGSLPAAMTLADFRTQVYVVRSATVNAAASHAGSGSDALVREIAELRRLLGVHRREMAAAGSTHSGVDVLAGRTEEFIEAARRAVALPLSRDADWWHEVDARLASTQVALLGVTRAEAAWCNERVRGAVARSRIHSTSDVRQLSSFSGLAAATAAAILLLVLRWMGRDRRAVEGAFGEVRRLEVELRTTAARLETAARTAGVGVWGYDLRTRELEWDGTMRRLHGYEPDEPLPPGRELRERVHPDDQALLSAQGAAALAGTGEFKLDLRVQRRDGQWRHLHVASAVQRDAGGTPVRLIGAAIDLTERVNIQRALLESRARLSVFGEHAPAAVAMFDTEMRYLLCTRRWLHDYGIEGECVAGRSHYEVFSEVPERWKEIHRRCLAGAVETCEEDPFERADGSLQWLRWEVRPWYTSVGAIGGVLMLTEDITVRREAQESLRRARAQAEDANRAKSEFLANMSHEIRTPMTAIVGYIDLLAEARHDDALFHQHATTIQSNAEHLLTVLNEVLDLSKIEAGRMTVESIACSPQGVAAEVVRLMAVKAGAKSIALELKSRGPIPERIMTDPTRLRQVLLNLVGNAIKFTEVGGVTVSVSMDDADRPGPAKVRFAVKDTGIGISPEHIPSLFDPFMQADSSMSRRFGGTGLGLAICKRLSSLLGGSITVESRLGEGSEFVLLLDPGPLDGVPMIDGAECVEQSDAGAHPRDFAGRLAGRVLLVEDGADNQRLIAHHLRRAGAEVEVAANGRLALERLCEGGRATGAIVNPSEFALVLMDMQMPEMDGYAAARSLREKGYAGPIVALTAHALDGDRERCLGAGCDDYLSKPIDRGALLTACGRWMGGVTEPAGRRTRIP